MTRLLLLVLAAVPGTALAHGLPTPHAHPHGIDLALGVAVIVAFTAYGVWSRRAVRRRSGK